MPVEHTDENRIQYEKLKKWLEEKREIQTMRLVIEMRKESGLEQEYAKKVAVIRNSILLVEQLLDSWDKKLIKQMNEDQENSAEIIEQLEKELEKTAVDKADPKIDPKIDSKVPYLEKYNPNSKIYALQKIKLDRPENSKNLGIESYPVVSGDEFCINPDNPYEDDIYVIDSTQQEEYSENVYDGRDEDNC